MINKGKPVYFPDTLYKITRDLKRQGKTIGLTHGAFDLFHFSHLDLLEKAATLCDFLIVGVDCDENIMKYKSYKRPLIGENSRLRIINELNCVDATFINTTQLNNDSYVELYKSLKVDIAIVGQRITFLENIRQVSKRSNSKFKIIETYQHPTTTLIINTIIEKYSINDSI
jgi:cytidyltransferase-like protein